MLIVYSKNNCPECAKTIAMLDAKSVPYKTVKVDEEPGIRAQLIALGHRSVPQIYVDGQEVATYVGDYKALAKLTDEELLTLLK